MSQPKVGDRVYVRGLAQFDCLGVTGKIVEVRPSALFPRALRCRVDFNGKIRRLLSVHLAPAAAVKRGNATNATAA
jgi:hypothetical protein